MHKYLLILGLICLSTQSFCQNILKGKIYDQSNNQALIGAAIVNPQTQVRNYHR